MFNASIFSSLNNYYSLLSDLGYLKFKEVILVFLLVDMVDMVDDSRWAHVFTDHPEYITSINSLLTTIEHNSEVINLDRGTNIELPIM